MLVREFEAKADSSYPSGGGAATEGGGAGCVPSDMAGVVRWEGGWLRYR